MNDLLKSITNAGVFFVVASVVELLTIFIFSLLTSNKYKIWEQINKGNIAVSLSTGGMVLGIANIMRYAIVSNDNVATTALWGGIGALALIVVYFAFEVLTPKLNVSEEIGKDNKAVGLISFAFSLACSFIIGACIS